MQRAGWKKCQRRNLFICGLFLMSICAVVSPSCL